MSLVGGWEDSAMTKDRRTRRQPALPTSYAAPFTLQVGKITSGWKNEWINKSDFAGAKSKNQSTHIQLSSRLDDLATCCRVETRTGRNSVGSGHHGIFIPNTTHRGWWKRWPSCTDGWMGSILTASGLHVCGFSKIQTMFSDLSLKLKSEKRIKEIKPGGFILGMHRLIPSTFICVFIFMTVMLT